MKYNHMLDICFTVDSDQENWESLSKPEILNALQARVDYLRGHSDEIFEALGYSDTMENWSPK